MQTMKQEDALSGFVQALKDTGLGRRLSDARSVTLFAPSNSAWLNLGVVNNYLRLHENGTSIETTGSLEALEAVVRYSIVDRVLYTADIATGKSVVKTSQGDHLEIEKIGEVIRIKEERPGQAQQEGGKLIDKGIH